MTARSPWQNRIVGSGEEAPDQLLANPKNWRTHPVNQREALRGALDQVGWVQQVMVNRVTGHIVDGHARVEEALSRGEASVPVLYVDLEPHEEDVVLATLDPIGALATRDDERLRMLLAEVEFDAAQAEALFGSAGMFDVAFAEAPDMESGDRDGFRQMSFIVSDEQAETIGDALRRAKAAGPFADDNANSNGNAIARIAEAYLG
jgi:hypothetical protein